MIKLATILLFICFQPISYALSTVEFKHIEQLCKQSSTDCLRDVPKAINSTKVKSRIWYKLHLLKYEALFALEKNTQLLQEVTPWIKNKNIPKFFQIYVFIYYAKEQHELKNTKESNQYLTKALTSINKLNDGFINPLLLVQAVNLQLYLPENIEQGYKNLISIEKKYQSYTDPEFQLELYSNLGHLALHFHQNDKHILYRQKAYAASKRFGNVQQMAVAALNLSKALTDADRLFEANNSLKQALSYAKQSHDKTSEMIAYLNLANVNVKQQHFNKANQYLQQIDKTLLTGSRLTLFNQLNQKLSQIKQPK